MDKSRSNQRITTRAHSQQAQHQLIAVRRATLAGDYDEAAIAGGELCDIHRVVTKGDAARRRGRQWKQTPKPSRSRR